MTVRHSLLVTMDYEHVAERISILMGSISPLGVTFTSKKAHKLLTNK